MSLALEPSLARRPLSILGATGNTLRTWAGHDSDFGRFGLLLPVVGAAGIAAAAAVPFDPNPYSLLASAVAALSMAWGLARSSAAVFSPIILALAAFLLGGFALSAQAHWFGTAVIERPTTAALGGTISAIRHRPGGREQIVVALSEADLNGPLPHRVRLSTRGDDTLAVGDRVRTKARLFPLSGPVLPGGYDAARRLYFDRIGATGFSYGNVELLEKAPADDVSAMLYRLRAGIAARIDIAMSPRTAPFATAVLVGIRGKMHAADVEALRVAGLGHILAISGLHMALVAGSAYAAVRFGFALIPALALRFPIKKWAAIAGLAFATAYLALSGGSVATTRAYAMLVIAMIAILADRPAITMRSVAVAATVLMALDPVSVLEPGFQMSFAAVIALVGAYEWWAKRPASGSRRSRGRHPALMFLGGLMATSAIAGAATAPIAGYHFHRLAPLSLPANVLAMPVFTFVAMPAGVIGLLAMPLGLEWLPLKVMEAALSIILAIAHYTAEHSDGIGLIGATPAWAALLAAVGLIWLAVSLAPWRLLGLALLAIGVGGLGSAPRPDVLVADDGVAIAVRTHSGRLAFMGKTNDFVAASWRRADGDPDFARKPPAPGRCDHLGCTVSGAGIVVAAPASARAHAEDCRRADIVVVRTAAPQNCAALVIDRAFLQRHGAVAANRSSDEWVLRKARPQGQVRRWHVKAYISH